MANKYDKQPEKAGNNNKAAIAGRKAGQAAAKSGGTGRQDQAAAAGSNKSKANHLGGKHSENKTNTSKPKGK